MNDELDVRGLLEEYRVFARTIALDSTKNVEYLTFGLINETEELIETLMPYFSDGIAISDDNLRKKFILEMGDILWYIVRLLEEIGIKAETFTDYWTLDGLQLQPPKDAHTAVGSKALTMMRRTARICGYVKKKIRGDSELRKEKMAAEIKEIVLAFMSILSITKTPLKEIIIGNVDKLSSRKDRGLLMGDGDAR